MSRPARKKPHGSVRRSQLLTTFGPGSMLDLPKHSVLVAGLDHWGQRGEQIHEPRLVAKLQMLLDLQGLQLFAPPAATKDPTQPQNGITAWQFPEWFIVQGVRDGSAKAVVRSRRLVHRTALRNGKYVDDDTGKPQPVVPVRFVRACRRGHIGDIGWKAFVHRDGPECARQLWVDERGTSGDIGEIWIRCECKQERSMTDAATFEFKALGACDGSRPWLGPFTKESCGELSRLLVRTASNAYFPQIMSVISLPDRDEAIVQALDRVWEHHLQYVTTLDDLQRDRDRKPPVAEALKRFTDAEVLEAIRARLAGADPALTKPVKQAEIEVLLESRDEIGADRPEGTFFARSLPRAQWGPSPAMDSVERVVLVHRLREVIAQVGFTRFEAAAPDEQGELDMGVQPAALAPEISWLPAVENRGEGFFVAFKQDAMLSWLARPDVTARGRVLAGGFDCWIDDHKASKRPFPGLPYIMLHSLSHALLTAVSLECGYPASSIRERVYSTPSGFGILLYTGSPDAEGTLGGLVETGRSIARHLEVAFELMALCSNDPVCAHHVPDDTNERRFLLGAACHGCLLIAETSCEQHNDFLDRTLVVPTIAEAEAAFFPGSVI